MPSALARGLRELLVLGFVVFLFLPRMYVSPNLKNFQINLEQTRLWLKKKKKEVIC